MMLSTIIGLLFSVVTFTTLVSGDPFTVITVNKFNAIHTENEYISNADIEIGKGKSSSQLTIKFSALKDFPETMQFQFLLTMEGEDPIEKTFSMCDSLEDEIIAKDIIAIALPKGKFPKECPFLAGDYVIPKYDPPMEKLPPGFPTGPFTATAIIMEEGKEPYLKIDFEGAISQDTPKLGR